MWILKMSLCCFSLFLAPPRIICRKVRLFTCQFCVSSRASSWTIPYLEILISFLKLLKNQRIIWELFSGVIFSLFYKKTVFQRLLFLWCLRFLFHLQNHFGTTPYLKIKIRVTKELYASAHSLLQGCFPISKCKIFRTLRLGLANAE